MKITWSILAVKATEGLITEAKYLATAKDGDLEVASEGNWFFRNPKLFIPFDAVTEQVLIGWVRAETMQDGKNIIEQRLAEQLASLATQHSTPLPWMPQVFTPEI